MHGRPAAQDLGETRTSHPQRWRILAVLTLALVVTSIDHTIINVALPRLVEDLGARIRAAHAAFAGRDILVIEGTGHAGVGAVIGLSNAVVAQMLGAPAVIVSEGGVGRPIDDLPHAAPPRAVRAAEVLAARLDAVPDDRTLAVEAARRERLDRALEGVERVGGPTDRDLERFVIGVAAALTWRHGPEVCNEHAGAPAALAPVSAAPPRAPTAHAPHTAPRVASKVAACPNQSSR